MVGVLRLRLISFFEKWHLEVCRPYNTFQDPGLETYWISILFVCI